MCSCLTRNFDAHWRALSFTATTAATTVSSASGASCTTLGSPYPLFAAALLPTERKVVASAARGLACAVGKIGVSAVLEPYLSRVIHALNHLVQPAGEEERATAASAAARGSRNGSSGSHSGSRSRSRGMGSVGPGSNGGGGLSPTRTGSRPALPDPRARVRLHVLVLLEAIAVKEAKVLYPHWALFLGGGGVGTGEGDLGYTFGVYVLLGGQA